MHLFQSDVSIPAAIGYSILGMAIVFAVLVVLMLAKTTGRKHDA